MSDEITLRINGLNFSGWKSVEITRQMDAIAGAFSIALMDKWSAEAEALPIAAGMTCEIFIGRDKVIDGHIDGVDFSFSASDHGITVAGRDRSADMVDCSALHAPGEWLNQTVLSIAADLAAPFGVSVRAEGDIGGPIASFKLEQGETAFEALNRALKQRELLACPDGSGGLVLLRPGAWSNPAALVQGQNVLSASASFDLADRFSLYRVQGQRPGGDDAFGEEAAAVEAEAHDASVVRFRPLIVRAESNVDSASAQQRAAWEATVRAARSVTLSAAVQGFRQGADGPLWQVNALTQAHIPYLRLHQPMLVSKVSFKRDAQSGSVTSLELKDPGAFAPAPRTEAEALGPAGPIAKDKDILTRMAEEAATRQAAAKGEA